MRLHQGVMTLTEVTRSFRGRVATDDIHAALAMLESENLLDVEHEQGPGPGRPKTTYRMIYEDLG